MLNYGFFICLAITITSSKIFMSSVPNESSLHLVNMVFRHGDRTPATYEEGEFYPTDPYLNVTFPQGYGQLTDVGKARSFALGKYLYSLYGSFLNYEYIPEEIYARSSDYNRTKMTLQFVLSGLFPSEVDDQGDPPLQRQQISILSCPAELDKILLPIKCPLYGQEVDSALKSPQVKAITAPYDELLKNLTEWSGRQIQNPLHVLNLYNTFAAEISLGLELPAWAQKVYTEGSLMEAGSPFYQLGLGTKNFKSMMSGRLLRRMLDNMLDKVNNSGTNRKKMYLYSAHDFNVGFMLVALGLYVPPHIPKYTSAVIIELLNLRCKWYVRIRHYEGIQPVSTIKTIPGCTEPCPLEQFIELVEKNLGISQGVQGYC